MERHLPYKCVVIENGSEKSPVVNLTFLVNLL